MIQGAFNIPAGAIVVLMVRARPLKLSQNYNDVVQHVLAMLSWWLSRRWILKRIVF